MRLLNSKAVHGRSVKRHDLRLDVLLRNRGVRSPRLLLGGVQAKGVVQHNRLTKGRWLSFPEVVHLGLNRCCHGAQVGKLLHIWGQLEHGELHWGLLSLSRRVRMQDVLLWSHESTGCNRGWRAESGVLNELRFLDGRPSGGWRSLHLRRAALGLHQVLR